MGPMFATGMRTRIVLGVISTGALVTGPFLLGREAVGVGGAFAVWAGAITAAACTVWFITALVRDRRSKDAPGESGEDRAEPDEPRPTDRGRPLRVGFTSPDQSAPSGQVEDVGEVFQGLERRRLLVLGDPGSGKSFLARTLARRLRESGHTPYVLPLDTWNPEANEDIALHAARAACDDLALGPDPSQSRALDLIRQGRVVLILDGLDEVRAPWRATAIAALEAFCALDPPLVITCRTHEFERAARSLPRPLHSFARIVLEPVRPDDALAFLTDTGQGPRLDDPHWAPVSDLLRRAPNGPLARALRSPLALTLALPTDPARLVERAEHSSPLRHLVQERIHRAHHEPAKTERPTAEPSEADRARIWLSHLAYHLYFTGRSRFHWWRTHVGLVPRWFTHGLLPVLVAIVAATLLSPALGLGRVGATPESPLALAALLLLGSLGVFSPLWRETRLTTEGHPRDHARHMSWDSPRHALSALSYGTLVGLAVLGGVMGALLGALFGVALGFSGRSVLSRPPSRAPNGPEEVSPSLTASRAVTLGFGCGVFGALFFALATWLVPSTTGIVSAAASGFLVCAFTSAHAFGLWPWLRFRATHLVLALKGHLPWRLQGFLDHAHRRGLLRPRGAAWGLEHALVRDHLADDVESARLTAQIESLYGAAGGEGRRRRVDESVALHNLVELHAERGDIDALHRLARTKGSATAEVRLADVLAEREDRDRLRELAHDGSHRARILLADLWARNGELDELRLSASLGHRAVGERLADALAARGATLELAAMADQGGWQGPASQVARLPTLHHVPDGGRWTADHALERLGAAALAESPRWRAARNLADLLAEREDLEGLTRRSDQGDWWAAERLAGLLAASGDLDGLATRSDRGDWWAAERLVPALLTRGDLDGALHHLALFQAKEHCWAFLAQAESRALTGDTEKAVQLLEEIKDRHRRQLGAQSWHVDAKIIDLWLGEGRPDAALPELRRQADRGREWAGRRLAVVLRDMGGWEELERRAGQGDAGAALTLADARAAQGRPGEALRVLELGFDPRSEEIGAALADAYARSGRVRRLRRLARTDPRARRRLARHLAENGRVAEAIALLRFRTHGGRERDPDTTRLLFELHRSWADAVPAG